MEIDLWELEEPAPKEPKPEPKPEPEQVNIDGWYTSRLLAFGVNGSVFDLGGSLHELVILIPEFHFMTIKEESIKRFEYVDYNAALPANIIKRRCT